MWRSVPDLLANGITIASSGIPNKHPNPRDPNEPGGQRIVTQASNAGNTDSTTTTPTAANASAGVPSDGKDAEKMVHVEIEED